MGNIHAPANKRIAFYVSDENGIRKGFFLMQSFGIIPN